MVIDEQNNDHKGATAVLVGLVTQQQSERKLHEYLDELEFLLETAGGSALGRFSQKLDRPNTATFIGPGKLLEIQTFIEENDANTLIFDDELSPSQLKNVDKVLNPDPLNKKVRIL